MSSALDLTPSLKKIERSKRKISNLGSLLSAYSGGDSISIIREVEGDTVHTIARVIKDPPEDIAWEVVEIVGHLRAALDKAVGAMVRQNERGISGVSFLFGGISNGKPDTFPTARIEHALKNKLTSAQWGAYLASKPYPGGNDLLWAINQIANEDKHRPDLVEAMPKPSVKHVRAGDFKGRLFIGGTKFEHLVKDKKREVHVFSADVAGDYTNVNATVSLYVVFGDIEPVAGREILTTLNQQVQLIERIIHTFGSVS